MKDVVIVIQQTMVCIIVTNYKRKWVDQVVDQELEGRRAEVLHLGVPVVVVVTAHLNKTTALNVYLMG